MKCEWCGIDFSKGKVNQRFCCSFCQKKASVKKCNETGKYKEQEKKQRELLSDRIIKRTIYIQGKGRIKYGDMTPEMIEAKRAQILSLRQRKENSFPKPVKLYGFCVVCGGQIVTGKKNRTICSDECGREKARRFSFKINKAKKAVKERLCNECGKIFTPEYGDQRRVFCSYICRYKSVRRSRKQKERALLRKAKVESVNAITVFNRDGWRCQLCHKKLRRADRGTISDNAPELDHIIPLSKGGEHSYRNTQCACRKCNSEKGGEERGQLRMFG
jgi:5-methylcytosine-specific restriction endonuclease McrA